MARLGPDDRPEVFEWHTEELNQNANLLTVPERARIVRLGAWIRGVSGFGSVSYRLCLWRGDGPLIGQSSLESIGTANVNVSNLTRVEHDLATPVEVDAAVDVMVGIAWSRHGALQFGWHDHGTLPVHRERTVDNWPASMGAASNHGGTGPMGAWIESYEPIAGAWVRRGSTWTRADSVYVRRTGAWVEVDGVLVRRSGSWTDAD